uniref:DUF1907 domain-containing protein n=1 Tax=Panagrellus redivivus TaxID=6233 RepID=A0A7E5A096_PANRE
MNSTLNPNLLVEVIALRREYLLPQKLCGLFLADRNFSEAFALAFHHQGNVRHHFNESRSFRNPNFTVKTKSGIVFQFTKEYHVPALLRIAGRLIQVHDGDCPDEKWVEPFFEGLDENKCLESVGSNCSSVFIEKYFRSHDVLPRVECCNFAMLNGLKNKTIDTLLVQSYSVMSNESSGNDEQVRVTNIEINCYNLRVNPLKGRGKTLKFDKKFFKRLTIFGKINPENAARMIACFRMAEEIELQQVIIPFQLGWKPMQEHFDRLKSHVDKVWQAVVVPSGIVNVTALYTRDLPGTLMDMATACKTHLKGYDVFTDNATRAILKKKQGNKTLEVRVALFETR